MLDITFYGVRGSTPCSGEAVARYGGNTSCVVVTVPDEDPIICDLGTGLRYFGSDLASRTDPFRGTALVTHLHWDHVQGLPFFTPVLHPEASLEIVGPVQQGCSLEEAMCGAIAPPMFPVALAELPGDIRFRELRSTSFEVGSAAISVFDVPHVGPTNGYRIDAGGASVAYLSDFQQPIEGGDDPAVPDEVLDHIRGVDVLIHDAQYDPGEFAAKSTWGHCTVAYAVKVARAAEAARLVLYHHDPLHDDAWIDRAVEQACGWAGGACEVMAAREGLVLHSGGR